MTKQTDKDDGGPVKRPTTSNADHWLLWLEENRETGNEWLAVQIAFLAMGQEPHKSWHKTKRWKAENRYYGANSPNMMFIYLKG